MSERAAIVTGASRGIGLAIATALARDGHAVTLTARRPEPLAAAAAALGERGFDVQPLAANLAQEDGIRAIVDAHRERYGRLDVLVNNGGIGVGAGVGELQTKLIDMQLDVNLRAIILMYREALELLRAAAAEHGRAQVVNIASIAGKQPAAWMSVYSASKAGVIAFSEAMNRELGADGIRSVALCPGWVDTDMTDFIKHEVPAREMIRPEDVAEAVRFVLALSPAAVVPEIVFERPGGGF
ncbi:MAG TPA: SDR family oxidoreductase [Solirubrobacteraceae bacterium]|nr:SDR family oxidoreductase [Solirubrobacteraceae bacterium]